MKRALSLTLVLILMILTTANSLPLQVGAQNHTQASELTNNDVLNMVKAGLAAEIIISKIKSSPSKFDTSASTLAELKAASVPDAVILAMVEASAPEKSVPAVTIAETEVTVPDGTEMEIQLKNTLSGQEAKVGDIVDFTVM
jgi:hypothetical protein